MYNELSDQKRFTQWGQMSDLYREICNNYFVQTDILTKEQKNKNTQR